jgi:hypothetical protein
MRQIHNTGGWLLYYFVLFGLQPEPEPEAAAAVCYHYHYQCPHVRLWLHLMRSVPMAPPPAPGRSKRSLLIEAAPPPPPSRCLMSCSRRWFGAIALAAAATVTGGRRQKYKYNTKYNTNTNTYNTKYTPPSGVFSFPGWQRQRRRCGCGPHGPVAVLLVVSNWNSSRMLKLQINSHTTHHNNTFFAAFLYCVCVCVWISLAFGCCSQAARSTAARVGRRDISYD